MSKEIKVIDTPNAPQPKGAYSQAFVHDGLVYVAGQLPLDPATGEVAPGDFQDHVKQALINVKNILEAAGSDLNHVLRINVYMTDVSQFPLLNEAYAEIMPAPYPPRTARVVNLGPYDVEIDACLLYTSPSPRDCS